MKVTFLEVPNPGTNPTGFALAMDANMATLAAAMELVVWRDRRETMLDILDFYRPQNPREDRPTTMNGYFRWRGDLILTSRPYSLEAEDGMGFGLDFDDRSYFWYPPDEALELNFGFRSGSTLTDDVVFYDFAVDEAIELNFGFGTDDGILETLLITYDESVDEAVELNFDFGDDGLLETVLIIYDNWPDEAVELNFELADGTLV